MPPAGAAAERLVRLPPGSSRLIARMFRSEVIRSRHLPAPSPNIPVNPAAPSSNSAALKVRAALGAKVNATSPPSFRAPLSS